MQNALVDKASKLTDAKPAPVRMLGLDETRAGSVRWFWRDAQDGVPAGWQLTNPWMTSFVDLDTDRAGWLLPVRQS